MVVVMVLYRTLRREHRWQNGMILVASYFFYGWWDERLLTLIVFSTVVDYLCAAMIDKGRTTRTQRRVPSIFLIAALVGFSTIRWREGHWWPDSATGWLPLVGGVIFVLAIALAHERVAKFDAERKRKLFVTVSVMTNLGILGVFKYYNFFAGSLDAMLSSTFGIDASEWALDIVLPVGISFYTFQTMSYTIDVYRKKMRAAESFLDFATYVAFFPQLVAGPIERGSHLLPQFQKPRQPLTKEQRDSALWLIAWGLYKKMVVADNMAVIVNRTFGPFDTLAQVGAPEDGLRLLVAVYAFAFQIYADFSGYTDIARGTARLLGFDLMLNFNLPYFSISPSDFWRRWHISLSTWLRDYLYIPLGGNRGGSFKTYRNLCLTMLLGGLWHGAAWNFIIWGAYHGALLVLFRPLETARAFSRPVWIRVIQGLVFFQFTCLGWLIFRARNVETIYLFLVGIFGKPNGSVQAMDDLKQLLFFGGFLIVFQVVQAASGKLDPVSRWPGFIRLNVWFFILFSCAVFPPAQLSEFIYFAF